MLYSLHMKNTSTGALQKSIGQYIAQARTQKSMTQKDLAKLLGTTQSAVARMEKGQQNFSSSLLQKIGEVLHTKIVSVDSSLDFKVTGGKKLSGTIATNSSKNGALAVMAASLLNQATTTLHGVPKIEEVSRFSEVLQSLGVKLDWLSEKTLKLTPPKNFTLNNLDAEAAGKIRVSLYLLPALLHNLNSFVLPNPGGCRMGSRTLLPHSLALENFGPKISQTTKGVEVKLSGKLKPADVVMFETSDMATVNAVLASSLVPGTSTISFASPNYQVQEVCVFLQKLGVDIQGTGTSTLTLKGAPKINKSIDYYLAEDPIESMMFIAAAVVTDSKLTIERCPIDFIKLELLKLKYMGLKYTQSKVYKAKNGFTKLVDITVFPSKLTNLTEKLHAQPYPGINSDNLPFFVPIASKAQGSVLIHDWMWENRAIYFTELNRLGGKITLLDPHRVMVEGPVMFKPAQVVCPPALRPAVIILISMLAAEGVSILRNVYSIKRGYEEIAERLNSIGGNIEILTT